MHRPGSEGGGREGRRGGGGGGGGDVLVSLPVWQEEAEKRPAEPLRSSGARLNTQMCEAGSRAGEMCNQPQPQNHIHAPATLYIQSKLVYEVLGFFWENPCVVFF